MVATGAASSGASKGSPHQGASQPDPKNSTTCPVNSYEPSHENADPTRQTPKIFRASPPGHASQACGAPQNSMPSQPTCRANVDGHPPQTPARATTAPAATPAAAPRAPPTEYSSERTAAPPDPACASARGGCLPHGKVVRGHCAIDRIPRGRGSLHASRRLTPR